MFLILRRIIIIALLFGGLGLSAKTSVKEQRKLLQKYDMPNMAEECYDGAQSWRYIQKNNVHYQEALRAAQSGRAREAQRAIRDAIYQIQSNAQPKEYISGISELLDSLQANSGIKELYPYEANINIDYSPIPNPYSLPDGTVYISLGMLSRLDFDYNLLMAVYAHELAHFTLQHAFAHIYFSKKKEKKALLLAGIASAVVAGAAAYGETKMAEMPGEQQGYFRDSAVDFARSMEKVAKKDARTWQFKYNREQEYEADILAYRFLESIGIGGGCLIEALDRIKSNLEIFSNDETTHPLTEDRIALLRYMSTNPNIKPKAIDNDPIYGQPDD